ncbi:hypothetical protein NCS52_01194500 [Fusarium sp. LHS14.1]|nr:hypothetical protein NCS52_01194500 [Fusarium sp. LHS14.1]
MSRSPLDLHSQRQVPIAGVVTGFNFASATTCCLLVDLNYRHPRFKSLLWSELDPFNGQFPSARVGWNKKGHWGSIHRVRLRSLLAQAQMLGQLCQRYATFPWGATRSWTDQAAVQAPAREAQPLMHSDDRTWKLAVAPPGLNSSLPRVASRHATTGASLLDTALYLSTSDRK